jgi:hypothetical protein
MKYLSVGVISDHTMEPEDTVPALVEALESVRDADMHPLTVNLLDVMLDDPYDPERDEADAPEIVSDLMDVLQEHAPAFTYVGAHSGDGSCLGVFPDENEITAAIRNGDLISVSDLSELPEDYSGYILLINDHGNTSLLSVRSSELTEVDNGKAFNEVWAIV